jgi:hypothetical protein
MRSGGDPIRVMARQTPRRGAGDRLVDACIDSYIEWREECENLAGAYDRWAGSRRRDRRLAFPAYRAALDREEKAALVYEVMVERVASRARRWRPISAAERSPASGVERKSEASRTQSGHDPMRRARRARRRT